MQCGSDIRRRVTRPKEQGGPGAKEIMEMKQEKEEPEEKRAPFGGNFKKKRGLRISLCCGYK
jgi:hypothetical protein